MKITQHSCHHFHHCMYVMISVASEAIILKSGKESQLDVAHYFSRGITTRSFWMQPLLFCQFSLHSHPPFLVPACISDHWIVTSEVVPMRVWVGDVLGSCFQSPSWTLSSIFLRSAQFHGTWWTWSKLSSKRLRCIPQKKKKSQNNDDDSSQLDKD